VEIANVSLSDFQLHTNLLPSLVGRVFHVTSLNAYRQIRIDGEIRSNVMGELPTIFGSTNSFFRRRNCVSFFDYRSASTEQIENAIGKCSPYHLPSSDPQRAYQPNIAFLFLSNAAHDRLIPWTKWKEEQSTEKIVPWVEAGYPGPVPITLIADLLCVTIEYSPHIVADALRRARFR
jgi:hypothetical protein